MQTVHDRLATALWLMLSAPPFVKTKVDVMRAVVFNPVSRKMPASSTTPRAGASWPVMLGEETRPMDILPGLHASVLQRARRTAPERAIRARPDYLLDLFPARR